MTRTIEIPGTGKKALADIWVDKNDPEGEITVTSLTTFSDRGKITYYGRKQCSKHEWKLYNLVKKYWYE